MILFFSLTLLFLSLRNTAYGAPPPLDYLSSNDSSSTPALDTRTVLSIIYSCIATTFACTWVSVHPNVPFFGEGEWTILGRKIHLMIIALIAPELMIMWAIKQSMGAQNIQKCIKDHLGKDPHLGAGWTMTHSHFLQMGGFKLCCTTKDKNDYGLSLAYRTKPCKSCKSCESFIGFNQERQDIDVPRDHNAMAEDFSGEGNPHISSDQDASSTEVEDSSPFVARVSECEGCIWEGVLTAPTFYALLDHCIISFPTITKSEILDRSKSDALGKTVAFMQIIWFIIQVITRIFMRLSITHLELTTFSLAVINGTMYFFWLQKPLDVHYPMVILSHSVERLVANNSVPILPEERERKASHPELLTVIQNVVMGMLYFVLRKIKVAWDASLNAHSHRREFIDSLVLRNPQSTPSERPRQWRRSLGDGAEQQSALMMPSHVVDFDHVASASTQNVENKHTKRDRLLLARRNPFWAITKRLLNLVSLLIALLSFSILVPAFLLQSLAWILGDTPLNAIIRPTILHAIDTESIEALLRSDTEAILSILDNTKLRVSLFASILYSETNSQDGNAYIFGTIAGFVFAFIHIEAIWLEFPSFVEKWLWALSTLLLLATCISFVVLGMVAKFNKPSRIQIWTLLRYNNRGWTEQESEELEDYDACSLDGKDGTATEYPQWEDLTVRERVPLLLLFVVLTTYGLIRFGILILAFTLLRKVPASTLQTIPWSNLLPHI